jgi:signal transduction histidine kinase
VAKRIVVFETASPDVRAAYFDALTARGLTVAETPGVDASVALGRDEGAITVRWSTVEPPERLSLAITATDLAAFVRLAAEVSDLERHPGIAEDAAEVRLLASIFVHDAINALAPMTFAADRLVALDEASVTELAESIVEGCRGLSSLMRQMMAMARGDGPRVVSVNAVIASLAVRLRLLAGRSVAITTRCEDPLPPVAMDSVDLERTILNLVANARDAMPDGGNILLSTSSVRVGPGDARGVRGVPDGRWVLLEVADHGAGMDSATLAHAFEAFFTTKPVGRGTGLGLTSVERAVHAASGEVRIRSQVGEGTVVQVWLPSSPRPR